MPPQEPEPEPVGNPRVRGPVLHAYALLIESGEDEVPDEERI